MTASDEDETPLQIDHDSGLVFNHNKQLDRLR
jgi:hypothetical protein